MSLENQHLRHSPPPPEIRSTSSGPEFRWNFSRWMQCRVSLWSGSSPWTRFLIIVIPVQKCSALCLSRPSYTTNFAYTRYIPAVPAVPIQVEDLGTGVGAYLRASSVKYGHSAAVRFGGSDRRKTWGTCYRLYELGQTRIYQLYKLPVQYS